MSSYKGSARKAKVTRLFMPVHGKKAIPMRQDGKVMKVESGDLLDDTAPDKPDMPADGGLEELKAERDSYLEMARRERADFDNYRKRIEREMRQMKRESLGTFLKEFFSPLDDLDRVLLESAKSQSFESLATGVRIMAENFWRSLAKAGVKKIDAKGKPFDPAMHEAMALVPSADMPPNTVLEVYDNGYKLDGFILRPAKVVVSCAPSNT